MRHTLLAFALAHCAVMPVGAVPRVSSAGGAGMDDGLVAVSMTRLLEELQSCEQCYVSGEGVQCITLTVLKLNVSHRSESYWPYSVSQKHHLSA